jgi:hypothetical protein
MICCQATKCCFTSGSVPKYQVHSFCCFTSGSWQGPSQQEWEQLQHQLAQHQQHVEQLQQQATAAHAHHAAEVQALRETSTAAYVALQVRAGQKYCVHAMECLQSSQPMQQGKSEQASVIIILNNCTWVLLYIVRL